MNSLRNLDLKKYLTGERLLIGLAVVLIVVIGLGYILFTRSAILPQWQARNTVSAQLASAQQKLVEANRAREQAPANLQQQLTAAQSTLTQAAQMFLSDAQAADALNKLYQYAGQSNVQIISLQAQPSPSKGQSTFDVRTFRVQVAGDSFQLIRFVTQIKEASAPGYVISNVSMANTTTTSVLTMDVALYTSPYSSVAAQPGAPVVTPTIQFVTPPPSTVVPTPTPTLTPEQQLSQQLDTAWASGNWQQAISLIQQIMALDPNASGMTQKLYTAHVNYGQALAVAGRLDDAKAEYITALTLYPNGAEAAAGLQNLAGPTPVPPTITPASPTSTPTSSTSTIYTVQRGDTLFSIARRYGVTVQAIMTANNLTSTTIRAGQQLIIPAH